MTEQYGISKRQAYRYIHEANKIGAEIPIPDHKIAFTVKLSQSLIQRLREYAKSSGKSLSEIVTQSLEVFLQNGRGRCSEKRKTIRNIQLEYSYDRLIEMKMIQAYQLLVPDKAWEKD